MSEKKCGRCRLLAVPLDAAGRRRVARDRLYECKAEIPAMPLMPSSITDRYPIFKHGIPADMRRLMAGDYGTDCSLFWELPKTGQKS